jgi:S-formylglutathione hydrolase FrmB
MADGALVPKCADLSQCTLANVVSRRKVLVGGGAAAVLAALGGGVAAEWDNPRVVRLRGGCGDTPAVPHASYQVTTGVSDSHAMGGKMPWAVAVPHETATGFGPPLDTPLVLCLTGLGDDIDMATTGIGFPGFATAAHLNLAFAVPGGGSDLYWHPRSDGRDPLSWAVDEFVAMVEQRFDVGGTPEKRAALGWSMGGYGALLAGQLRPYVVGAVAALSPAVFPSYDAARSGHSSTFDSAEDWHRYGLWPHLDELTVPVRIDCGSYDPFAPTARELLKRIPGASGGIESGCHDQAFWRRRATTSLRFLADNLSTERM